MIGLQCGLRCSGQSANLGSKCCALKFCGNHRGMPLVEHNIKCRMPRTKREQPQHRMRRALVRPRQKFSKISAAIWRPLPTPGPAEQQQRHLRHEPTQDRRTWCW